MTPRLPVGQRKSVQTPSFLSGNAATSDAAAVTALEGHLGSISPATQPDQWALGAYRLAMALGEDASTDRVQSLQRALTLLQKAAVLLDADRAPLEHARILNTTGATWRGLGKPVQQVQAFTQAAKLLQGRGTDSEVGSVLSNLGLAHLEAGDFSAALTTFDEAHVVLRRALAGNPQPQERRALASAALNRAQALLALPDGSGEHRWNRVSIGAAIASVEEGLSVSTVVDSPLQVGMLRHTLGLIYMRADRCGDATSSFTEALAVFSRSAFPFQHAIATFNRGRAFEQIGNSLKALIDYENAAQLFDPRLHREQWHEAAGRLAAIETYLGKLHPGAKRADHVARLLIESISADRLLLIRERIGRALLRSPEVQRRELAQMAEAALRLPVDAADTLLRGTIEVLMELPEELLRSGLLAQLDAHATLSDEERIAADLRFDTAIQELMMGPQRVRMRDILYEAGWERP